MRLFHQANLCVLRRSGEATFLQETQEFIAVFRYADLCLVLPCRARRPLLAKCRPKRWRLSIYSALPREPWG